MNRALPMGPWSWAAVALATVVGLLAFGWPFLAEPGSAAVAHASDASWIFAAVIPLVLLVVLAQIAEGGMDAKSIAILGVLAAVVTALRPLGAGTAGLEPIWFVIVLGGRALGPGFGFALGSLSLASSALITGGVGPWLPFQMIAAAWVGCVAGLLPPMRGKAEIAMLAAYGMVASMTYGLVMNLWFWPFLSGMEATAYADGIMFDPGAPVSDNLARWLAFTLVTSLGWDIPRGILTAVLIVLVGRPVLNALRRTARRANFAPAVEFVSPPPALAESRR
ncbi:MAG: ECF transporter S component [Actinomycetales bacterium]|nr:ECF transporter S component [Actinomycetales bacterium]